MSLSSDLGRLAMRVLAYCAASLAAYLLAYQIFAGLAATRALALLGGWTGALYTSCLLELGLSELAAVGLSAVIGLFLFQFQLGSGELPLAPRLVAVGVQSGFIVSPIVVDAVLRWAVRRLRTRSSMFERLLRPTSGTRPSRASSGPAGRP